MTTRRLVVALGILVLAAVLGAAALIVRYGQSDEAALAHHVRPAAHHRGLAPNTWPACMPQ